ncbi:unnamed protein product [Arctogadus glacialis]
MQQERHAGYRHRHRGSRSLRLPLRGLKRARNPERMIRVAVGYTGHAPPKSDDTDANKLAAEGLETEEKRQRFLGEPGQLKIYLPKKLLECLPKCSSLPKERHRWNTNEWANFVFHLVFCAACLAL